MLIPTIIIVIVGIVLLIGLYIIVRPSLSLYIHAFISGARKEVGLYKLVKMRWEKVKPENIERIVVSSIMGHKAGVHIDSKRLEEHLRAGGDINKVVQAMIMAKNAGEGMTFSQAASIDLSGRDVIKAVNLRIKPAVYDTPEIVAKAMDGIELIVSSRVTLRSSIPNFATGADQETILARIGDGIVSAVGSAKNHQDIIADPYKITEHILSRDQDADDVLDIHQDTAFEVMSIDISDINVGRDLNAEIERQSAEAQAKKARAEADEKRAQAIAREKAMKTRINEMKSKLEEAEAAIPLALAKAIRDGSFE